MLVLKWSDVPSQPNSVGVVFYDPFDHNNEGKTIPHHKVIDLMRFWFPFLL